MRHGKAFSSVAASSASLPAASLRSRVIADAAVSSASSRIAARSVVLRSAHPPLKLSQPLGGLSRPLEHLSDIVAVLAGQRCQFTTPVTTVARRRGPATRSAA